MEGVASPEPTVRPNYSLERFARTHLLSEAEWKELDRVGSASGPETKTVLQDGLPVQKTADPSPEFVRKQELERLLLEQFWAEMRSGNWTVTAIPTAEYSRRAIDTELLEHATEVYFKQSRIGKLARVEVTERSGTDRYLQTKWFIEQVCSVVPPKRGLRKAEIFELALRLLPFSVREDIFKAAWASAKKPPAWEKPGP